jgi:argininosuccinate lyase
MTLWGGRFSEPSDDDLRALNDSIEFDKELFEQDIAGSIAYARALTDAKVITEEENEQLIAGLTQIHTEILSGDFIQIPSDEDIHTAVERRLTEIAGAVGGKLHTGRSRNDQVATDFRLWVIHTMDEVAALIKQMQEAFIVQAEQHLDTIMPGYTHMQPAQPITAAHWLMSYFWMLMRDQERLRDAKQRTSVSPLGAGALAGTPLAIDRAKLAARLGFDSVSQNSLDAVSDRDFVAETLFVLALLGTHLSRFAEDVIIYSNPSFGFITLNDRYSTGSSIMPQKRNPDPLELARGKAGRLIGHLTGLMTTLKGLPSTYNKDLQEDKEPLFDAVETLRKIMPVLTAIIRTLHLNPEKMLAALPEEILATDLAEYLVQKGMPFREAHHVVGRVVRHAQDEKIAFSKIPLEKLRELSERFSEDVKEVFDFAASVARRKSIGGTAPEAVKKQIAEARKLLAEDE